MLSEEEKKAIKLIKQYRKEIKDGDIKPIFILDTAINLITKLQKENEILKRAFDKQTADMSNNLLELRQKDKQIDLMALTLSNVCTGIPSIIEQFEKEYCEFINSNEDCCWKTDKNCQDCIKQYFEKQAKEKGD